MVLKKQTVWLLTMLSLIVVLSVYYVTTPSGTPSETANVTNSKKASTDKATGMTASVSGSDLFAEYRLDRDQNHHDLAEKLQSAMTSKDATAVEVSKAQDQLKSIDTLASKEKMLEDMIMSKGYDDAVVDASHNGEVNVYVQADSLSNAQANEIIKMVYDQLGTDDVRITYESGKSK
ncbi:MAG: SpoIIIAH-like family protein [Tuberibacillus sp.]